MAYGLLFHRVGVTYHGNGGDKSVIDKILNHIPHYTTQNALDGTSSHSCTLECSHHAAETQRIHGNTLRILTICYVSLKIRADVRGVQWTWTGLLGVPRFSPGYGR